MDGSYNVEPDGGSLDELDTWKRMAKSGEMPEEALEQCAPLPFIEYEVSGLLDFEGLEEAKKLLISPKKRRLEAGLDPMLSKQGPSVEQRRKKNKRRIERISEMRDGVNGSVINMREMAAEGYDPRQIGLRMIIPRVGRKLSAKKRKLSAQEKAKQHLRMTMLRRMKAQAKAKAKAKGGAKDADPKRACWYFNSSTCSKGQNCRFEHVKIPKDKLYQIPNPPASRSPWATMAALTTK